MRLAPGCDHLSQNLSCNEEDGDARSTALIRCSLFPACLRARLSMMHGAGPIADTRGRIMRDHTRRMILAATFFCFFVQCGEPVEGLLSKQPLERGAAYKQIRDERKAMIASLISVFSAKDLDMSFRGPFHCAIELLGVYRAEEAIKPLCDVFTYVPDRFFTTEMVPREMYFVAAVALAKTGQPAVNAMLSIIRASKNKERRDLAAWVIMEIEGKEQAIYRLDSEAKKASPEDRERFSEARSHLETWKPVFERPKANIPSTQPAGK